MKTRSQTYSSPNDNITEKKKKGKEIRDVKYIDKTRSRKKSNITPIGEISDLKQNKIHNTRNRKKKEKSLIQSTQNKVKIVNKQKFKTEKERRNENEDTHHCEKDTILQNQYSPKILRSLLEEKSYKIRGKQQKIDADNSFCNSNNAKKLRCSLKRKGGSSSNTESIMCVKDDDNNNNNNNNNRQNKQSKKINNNSKENCAINVKNNNNYNEKSENDTENKAIINKLENVELIKSDNELSLGNRKINIHGIIIEEINKFETNKERTFRDDDDSCLEEDKKTKNDLLDSVHIEKVNPEHVIDKAFPLSENMNIEEQRKQCNTNEIKSENCSENKNNNQIDTSDFVTFNDSQNDAVNEYNKEIDSDSSPEEVTFQNSQNKALTFIKDAEDEVRKIKLQTKESRRKYHERNFMQKEEKKKRILELKAKKLPQNILDDLSKLKETKQLNEHSEKTYPKKIKFDEENEDSDIMVNQEQEELISIHGNTEFKVCKLNNFVRKPMSIAESAKEWKHNLLFGKKNKRESVKEMMAKKVKQSVAEKLFIH